MQLCSSLGLLVPVVIRHSPALENYPEKDIDGLPPKAPCGPSLFHLSDTRPLPPSLVAVSCCSSVGGGQASKSKRVDLVFRFLLWKEGDGYALSLCRSPLLLSHTLDTETTHVALSSLPSYYPPDLSSTHLSLLSCSFVSFDIWMPTPSDC